MQTLQQTVVPHLYDATLASTEQLVAAIAAGQMVVLVDAPDRENEGDLVVAADHVTPEQINFMATHGRGLICCAMPRSRLDALGIGPMVEVGDDPLGTAFHVSVDHARDTSTGISATDRAATIRALAAEGSVASDFRRPGHVFPLASLPGGVLRREGHTEASVELARLAGRPPAAVICEIAREDGEMARLPELLAFARTHGLLLGSIRDLVAYRRRAEFRVERVGEAEMPLDAGGFRIVGYRETGGERREHFALVHGDPSRSAEVLVRLHSECITGDVLGSRRCDCGRQLDLALQRLAAADAGVLIYLRGHEGRGIGLLEKLRAYALQDRGFDTVDANLALGHPVDARTYEAGAAILDDLGVDRVRLLTNNPDKRHGLEMHGIDVIEQCPLVAEPREESTEYLAVKARRLGHAL